MHTIMETAYQLYKKHHLLVTSLKPNGVYIREDFQSGCLMDLWVTSRGSYGVTSGHPYFKHNKIVFPGDVFVAGLILWLQFFAPTTFENTPFTTKTKNKEELLEPIDILRSMVNGKNWPVGEHHETRGFLRVILENIETTGEIGDFVIGQTLTTLMIASSCCFLDYGGHLQDEYSDSAELTAKIEEHNKK